MGPEFSGLARIAAVAAGGDRALLILAGKGPGARFTLPVGANDRFLAGASLALAGRVVAPIFLTTLAMHHPSASRRQRQSTPACSAPALPASVYAGAYNVCRLSASDGRSAVAR